MNFDLHLGDCRDILSALAAADAVVSDPPYGIGYRVNSRPPRGANLKGTKATATGAKPMVFGDDAPFDPAPWLAFPKVALFGANYFADKLPTRGKWVVWDKRGDMAPDDHSDCELVWLNAPGALRIHRQKWRGVVREGEENCSRSKKLHQNQKPVALLARVIAELKIPAGATIVDPFMGSGSTGVAALRAGCNFIGCEIDPAHFETARRRISQEAIRLELAA